MRYRENGFDLTIDFQYSRPGVPNSLGGRATTCVISRGNQTLATGAAVCGNSDVFRRAQGRKVALARALKLAGYDVQTRTNIWNWYWTQVRDR